MSNFLVKYSLKFRIKLSEVSLLWLIFFFNFISFLEIVPAILRFLLFNKKFLEDNATLFFALIVLQEMILHL